MTPFSDRALPPREPSAFERAVERAVDQRRARGGVLDLSITRPIDAGLAGASAPSPVDPGARARLASELEAPIEQVLLAASVAAALRAVLSLLTDPGDEVLGPSPGAPVLADLAHLASVQLVTYPAPPGRGPDLGALYDAIGERTRAIVAQSPHEPTGAMLDAEGLEALASLGLPLVIDERLAGYPLAGGARARPVAQESLVLRVGACPEGAPIEPAWIAASGPHAREAIDRLALAVEPPQAMFPSVAREPWRAAIQERCARNLDALRALPGLTTTPAFGGWLAPLRLPGALDADGWALALLDRGVLVRSAASYDLDGPWILVSLLTPPAILDEAIGVLRASTRDHE